MSTEKLTVDTPVGPTEVAVSLCDECSRKVAREISYTVNAGWSQLITRDGKSISARNSTLDFCSVDCLLKHLVPDIFTDDSEMSREVIARLRMMVRELA